MAGLDSVPKQPHARRSGFGIGKAHMLHSRDKEERKRRSNAAHCASTAERAGHAAPDAANAPAFPRTFRIGISRHPALTVFPLNFLMDNSKYAR